MDRRQKLRWTLLISALAVTIGAIFYPLDEQVSPLATAAAKSAATSRIIAAPVAKEDIRSRPIWIASDENPFAPQTWEAVPSAQAESTRTVQAVELAQASPEPPPAPLPYRFLGQMQDGANRILYLGHGEQVLLAHQGDVLEGSYKVVAVGDGMIEFEAVQSGIKQTLPIPAQ